MARRVHHFGRRHSSRDLPVNDSMNAVCAGFLEWTKCSFTAYVAVHVSIGLDVNCVSLSQTSHQGSRPASEASHARLAVTDRGTNDSRNVIERGLTSRVILRPC